jgi:hypothetical protein
MANIIKSDSIAPALPADDYFTPEARALCWRGISTQAHVQPKRH